MTREPCVFIVDDDPAVRDAHRLLCEVAGLSVETFESAEAFLRAYVPGCPGCLVLDLNMPGMKGDELQEALTERQSSLPIVFLSAYGDIPTTVRTIKAGAIDFLTKPVQGRLLLERIRYALAEDARMRDRIADDRRIRERLAELTPREVEVLNLAAAGHGNKTIARLLGISHRTVEIHRSKALEKTGAGNMLELVRLIDKFGAQFVKTSKERKRGTRSNAESSDESDSNF